MLHEVEALETARREGADARALTLARLDTGKSTDDSDAHFRLACVALLAGGRGGLAADAALVVAALVAGASSTDAPDRGGDGVRRSSLARSAEADDVRLRRGPTFWANICVPSGASLSHPGATKALGRARQH
jgi:hypothetical protein